MPASHNNILGNFDWREEEFHQLTRELAASRAMLHTQLAYDVRPEDILIGGPAVRKKLEKAPPSWCVEVPEAIVTIERWVQGPDFSVVRLAKTRCDDVTYDNRGLLARQIRGTGNWIPGARISERRTAKIAELALRPLTLLAGVFDADKPVNDEDFKTMRAAALHNSSAQTALRHTLRLDDRTLADVRKEDLLAETVWHAQSKYGWDHILKAPTEQERVLRAVESCAVQADAELTEEDLSEAAAHVLDKKMKTMQDNVHVLRGILSMTMNGQVVRPSQPQHASYLQKYAPQKKR